MHQFHPGPLAIAMGTCVGLISGLYAARAAKTAARDGHDRYRRRLLLGAGSGMVAGAAMGARFGTSLELAAYLLLVAVALPLSAIDLAVRKVPDRILLPAFPASAALLALAAQGAGEYGALWRALFAGAATFTAYLALALITQQLGLGDCKAAGLCGIFLGYLDWRAVTLSVLAAFVLAAAVTVGRMASSSARDKTVAFAPYIFAGTLIVVVLN